MADRDAWYRRAGGWIAETVLENLVKFIVVSLLGGLYALWSFRTALSGWLSQAHSIPGWMISILALFSAWGLLAAALQVRARWLQSRRSPYEVYRKDRIWGVMWRWRWVKRGVATDLAAYCPECDMEMDEILPGPCPSCGWKWNFRDFEEFNNWVNATGREGCVLQEVERRARGDEWREALSMQENEPPALSPLSWW